LGSVFGFILALAVAIAGCLASVGGAGASGVTAPTVCGPATCADATARTLTFSAAVRYAPELMLTASGELVGRGLALDPWTHATNRSPAVAVAAAQDGRGYWIAEGDGAVLGVDGARSAKRISHLASQVVAISANPSGRGYWLVTARGHVYARAGAKRLGSLHLARRSSRVVAIAATSDGRGYYVVERNGRVTPIGDARFALPASKVGTPVVGIAVNTGGGGYWLVSQLGRVTAVGGAPDYGEPAHVASAVVGIAATPDGHGYVLAQTGGEVLRFGDALATSAPSGRLVAIAGNPRARAIRVHPNAPASLHVNLTDLPPATIGAVSLSGPHGFFRHLSHSGSLRDAPAGTYTITAEPFRWKKYTVEAQWKTTTVIVGSGARATVDVPYDEVINPQARSISPRAILSVREPAVGQYVVRASDPTSALTSGNVLAAAPGSADPDGLLLDIGAVTRSGGVDTFDATRATVTEIAPAGAISVSGLALSVPHQPRVTARARRPRSLARDLFSDNQFQYDDGVPCTGGTSVSVTGGVNFKPNLDFSAKWGGFWHPLTVDVTFEVGSTQQFRYSATVAGNVTCQYSKDLLKNAIKLGSIKLDLAGFPVVINPTLNFELDAQGTVTGSARISATENSSEEVGLKYNGHLSPVHSYSGSFSIAPQDASASAQFQVGIAPQLNFGFYDTGTGPFVGAEEYLEYDIGTGSPWWTLLKGLQPYAGLQLKALGHTWSWTHNWSPWTSVIDQARTPLPPSVTTTSLPKATTGSPYSATLAAKNGAAPISWSATGLPAGLSLDSMTGVISGTPTAGATDTVTVTPHDHDGQNGSAKALSLQVGWAVPTITTTSVPQATIGSRYTLTLTGRVADGTPSWSLLSGTLPAGLSLNRTTGVISGTPTSAAFGTSSVTIALTDAGGQRATVTLRFVVLDAPISVTTSTVPAGALESSYSTTLAASGGTSPYTWAVTSGALPAGLALNASTGAITGTPIVSGTFMPVQVTVTDARAESASVELSFTVSAPANLLENGVGTFLNSTETTGAWYDTFSPNAACLTAGTTADQAAAPGGAGSISPCNFTTPDASGSGALELTDNGSGANGAPTGNKGAVFYNSAIPTSAGLDITFDTYQFDSDIANDNWTAGGGVQHSGADGISFSLAAVNPATSELPAGMTVGPPGADLGYAASGSLPGLSDGYLGIGLDAFGNFANAANFNGCSTPTGLTSGDLYPEAVTVHGPGNGESGYCILASSAQQVNAGAGYPNGGGWNQSDSDVNNPGGGPLDNITPTTRGTNDTVPVEVIINTTSAAALSTDDSSFTVPAGDWGVIYKPIGGTWALLVGALPTTYPTGYPTSWINPATNLPYEITFGWTASWGANNEIHEVSNVQVAPLRSS
jgi:hypothetical protein